MVGGVGKFFMRIGKNGAWLIVLKRINTVVLSAESAAFHFSNFS